MATQTFYVDTVSGNDTTGTGTSGAPYATLSNALSASNNGIRTTGNHTGVDYTNITTANGGADTLVIECSGTTADTGNFSTAGFTTGASNFITINGDNTTGKYSTSHYRIEHTATGGSQEGLNINPQYTVLNDIQVKITDTAQATSIAFYATGADCSFVRCIAVGVVSGTSSGSHGFRSDVANTVFRNCLSYGFNQSDSWGIRTRTNSGQIMDNCTAYDCTNGFGTDYQVSQATNCLAMSCTDGFNGTFLTSDYNASDIASDAPGANSNNGTAASFIDAAGGDFTLANGDTVALDQGDDLAVTFTDDLKGKTRSIWSIGAIESAGVVYINDATTLDGGEVEQTYPGVANWADGQIDMQTVPDTTGLTPPLYVLVELPNGSLAYRAVTVGGAAGTNTTIIVPTGPPR